jgi:hypothetical protein
MNPHTDPCRYLLVVSTITALNRNRNLPAMETNLVERPTEEHT